jgi:hypothetical protein
MGRTIARFDWTAASASRGVIRVVAMRSAITIVVLRLMPMKQWACKRCQGAHVYFCISGTGKGKGKVAHQDAIRRALTERVADERRRGRECRRSEPS